MIRIHPEAVLEPVQLQGTNIAANDFLLIDQKIGPDVFRMARIIEDTIAVAPDPLALIFLQREALFRLNPVIHGIHIPEYIPGLSAAIDGNYTHRRPASTRLLACTLILLRVCSPMKGDGFPLPLLLKSGTLQAQRLTFSSYTL